MDDALDLRGVRRILEDRRSGASEIERALRTALAGAAASDGAEVEAALDLASEVVAARLPVMAPLVRLLDEARAAWRAEGPRGLARVVERRDARGRAVALARRLGELGRAPERILTLSRSGTVLDVLGAWARGERGRPGGDGEAGRADALPELLVGEGRPEGEGVTMTSELAALGYRAAVVVDAALPALAAGGPAPPALAAGAGGCWVLLGCDAVGPGGFVNKVGSYALARAARDAGLPVFVVAESRKLLPVDLPLPWERVSPAGREPERLRFDFERVPLESLTRCVVEDAALDPAALRRRLASLPVPEGPLLRRLASAGRGGPT